MVVVHTFNPRTGIKAGKSLAVFFFPPNYLLYTFIRIIHFTLAFSQGSGIPSICMRSSFVHCFGLIVLKQGLTV